MEVERTTLCGTKWNTTVHEVPEPPGFLKGKRMFHQMYVEGDGRLNAIGRTCCVNRQYGCAYLGSCTAEKPPDIPMGHIADYPVVE